MSQWSKLVDDFNRGLDDICRQAVVQTRLSTQYRIPYSIFVIGVVTLILIVVITSDTLRDELCSSLDALFSNFIALVDQRPLIVIGGGVVLVLVSLGLLSQD